MHVQTHSSNHLNLVCFTLRCRALEGPAVPSAISQIWCEELLLSANFEISPALESKLHEYVRQLEQAEIECVLFMPHAAISATRLPQQTGLILPSAFHAVAGVLASGPPTHGRTTSGLVPSWSCKLSVGTCLKRIRAAPNLFRTVFRLDSELSLYSCWIPTLRTGRTASTLAKLACRALFCPV